MGPGPITLHQTGRKSIYPEGMGAGFQSEPGRYSKIVAAMSGRLSSVLGIVVRTTSPRHITTAPSLPAISMGRTKFISTGVFTSMIWSARKTMPDWLTLNITPWYHSPAPPGRKRMGPSLGYLGARGTSAAGGWWEKMPFTDFQIPLESPAIYPSTV